MFVITLLSCLYFAAVLAVATPDQSESHLSNAEIFQQSDIWTKMKFYNLENLKQLVICPIGTQLWIEQSFHMLSRF